MTDESLSEKRARAGRKGGLKGGKAKTKKGFATLPREAVRKISRRANKARWSKTFDGMEYEDIQILRGQGDGD